MNNYEQCYVCHCLTGRTGRDDDSLYTSDGKGPYCNNCYLLKLYDTLERRQILRQPLSREAQDARKPSPPEQLIDALQDRIHHNIGHGRAANAVSHKQLSDAVCIEDLEYLLTDQLHQIEKLNAEVERLQKALEFYRLASNWEDGTIGMHYKQVASDGGRTAREALEAEEAAEEAKVELKP